MEHIPNIIWSAISASILMIGFGAMMALLGLASRLWEDDDPQDRVLSSRE